MLIRSWQIVAILAVVFLSVGAPSQRLTIGEYNYSVGYATLFGAAWADTGSEADAVMVDCVLSGKIRPMGSITYVTREQTIKTTLEDCEARGGKPVNPEKPEAQIPGGDPAKQDDHSPK